MLELEKKRWTKLETSGAAPVLGWHSATIIRNYMFLVGGMKGNDQYSGDVHVLDLKSLVWRQLTLANGMTGIIAICRDGA